MEQFNEKVVKILPHLLELGDHASIGGDISAILSACFVTIKGIIEQAKEDYDEKTLINHVESATAELITWFKGEVN